MFYKALNEGIIFILNKIKSIFVGNFYDSQSFFFSVEKNNNKKTNPDVDMMFISHSAFLRTFDSLLQMQFVDYLTFHINNICLAPNSHDIFVLGCR